MEKRKIFKAYCWDYRYFFGLFLAEIMLLGMMMELAEIAREISFYLLWLHFFLFGIAFLLSFLNYRREYRYWQKLREKKEEGACFFDMSKTPHYLLLEPCEAVIQKQAELLQKQEAENKNRLREYQEYYGLWVHQMKTPIFALELLQREVNESQKQAQMNAELLKIKDYSQLALQYIRLADIANDMDLKELDLFQLIKAQLKKYSILFINQKIRLDLEEFSWTILSDEKWMAFVLGQILSNALKYTAMGGKINIFRLENCLIIEDNGLGIRAEDIPKLFQKGFTGRNGRIQKEASGLGLYLSGQVMQHLGHKIRLESEPGKGTRVYLEFDKQKIEDF